MPVCRTFLRSSCSGVHLLGICGNFIVTTQISLIGTKKSLYLYIIVYTVASLVFINSESFVGYAIGGFLVGMNDQILVVTYKIIMSASFFDDYARYLSFCYAGYAFSSVLVPYLMGYIINPDSKNPNLSFIESGSSVLYFDQSIVDNINSFLKLQLIVHVLILTFLVYITKLDGDDGGALVSIVQLLLKKERKSASLIFKESQTRSRIRINFSQRNSFKRSSSKLNKVTSNRSIQIPLMSSIENNKVS